MVDTNLGNSESSCVREYWNESVKLAIDSNFFTNFGLKHLHAAVVVVQLQSCQFADQPIKDFAGVNLMPRVQPLGFPTIDDIKPFLQFGDESWNLGGVILQVGIEHANGIPARAGHSRSQRSRLTKISAETEPPHAGIKAGKSLDFLP